MPQKDSAEKAVSDILRKTRRKFSAEERLGVELSPYGTSWHLMALPNRTKFSE
jgi:hypothetical protein